MNAHGSSERSAQGRSKRLFWRHFGEMLIVMLLSMALLGAVVSGAFALLGHANVLHLATLRGLLMTTYMVVGMVVWMRYRRHTSASVFEMGVAMAVPYAALIGPFAAGLIDEATFLGAMHILMLPCMYVAMLRRREEYGSDHARHRVR